LGEELATPALRGQTSSWLRVAHASRLGSSGVGSSSFDVFESPGDHHVTMRYSGVITVVLKTIRRLGLQADIAAPAAYHPVPGWFGATYPRQAQDHVEHEKRDLLMPPARTILETASVISQSWCSTHLKHGETKKPFIDVGSLYCEVLRHLQLWPEAHGDPTSRSLRNIVESIQTPESIQRRVKEELDPASASALSSPEASASAWSPSQAASAGASPPSQRRWLRRVIE